MRWYTFLSLATRGDASVLGRVAASVLRIGRPAPWRALLRVVRHFELTLDPSILLTALQQDEPGVRAETYWHLASLRARGEPIPDAVAATVQPLLAGPGEPALGPFEAFSREILGRAMGRPATRDGTWMPALRDEKLRSRGRSLPNLQVLTYFTKDEMKAAGFTAKDVPEQRVGTPPSSSEPTRRSPSGYPAGLVPDVLALTGCQPAPHLPPAMAEVVYGRDGRPLRISLIESLVPPDCATAARVLLLTALSPLGEQTRPDTPEALILPFQREFMTCLGTGEQEPPTEMPTDPAVAVEPPKDLGGESLIYPRTARRAGAEGIVEIETLVTSTGCVGSFRITRGRDPKLYWEVITTELTRHFSPMRVAGAPVPTTVSHRVNFRY